MSNCYKCPLRTICKWHKSQARQYRGRVSESTIITNNCLYNTGTVVVTQHFMPALASEKVLTEIHRFYQSKNRTES